MVISPHVSRTDTQEHRCPQAGQSPMSILKPYGVVLQAGDAHCQVTRPWPHSDTLPGGSGRGLGEDSFGLVISQFCASICKILVSNRRRGGGKLNSLTPLTEPLWGKIL